MARMRYTKPEFWTDSRMVRLSRDARLFYIGTWNFALCDKGHLEDDPVRLKMQIFPADDVDVPALLDELIQCGRIVRLTAPDGTTWLHIRRLEAHQKVDARWTPRCPACKAAPNLSETLPSSVEALTWGNAPKLAAETPPPENLSETLPNSPQEGRGGEGIGESSTCSSPATPATVRVPPGAFDTFWQAYPRKVGKDRARPVFDRVARKLGTTEPIILGAERLAADPNLPEREFIPHPTTWLARGGWEDEPFPARTNGRPPERPRAGAGVWSQVVGGEPQ